MAERKPIRVFWSELTERFYATAHYKISGTQVTVTGPKFDVTNDIAGIIAEHEVEFTKIEEPS